MILSSRLHHLIPLFNSIYVSNEKGEELTLDAALDRACEMITQANEVSICGNGGSQCQATHRALDLARLSVPARALDNAPRITAEGNDVGQQLIFETQLRASFKPTDLLWLISASGWSSDILFAARLARDLQAALLTFSGFAAYNPLRPLGHLNFWVNSSHYGHVEMMHEIIGHTITDLIAEGGSLARRA